VSVTGQSPGPPAVQQSRSLSTQTAILFFCVCVVLGFELRAFSLTHSTGPIFVNCFIKIECQELFV
jgi:hypothetical protein